VYRHGIKAGQEEWEWQQKDTLVWSHTNTEAEALGQIKDDALNREVVPVIQDISVFRPGNTEEVEPAATQALLAEQQWDQDDRLPNNQPQLPSLETVMEEAGKQAERVAEIAAELGEYASLQAPLPYVNAEAALAESFRQQLATGSKTINLSQRYATDDQALAQQRHEKALENLMPLIREAAALEGYTVQRGTAIADDLLQREVPAISQRQNQSVGL
jgi:hypothetical protein